MNKLIQWLKAPHGWGLILLYPLSACLLAFSTTLIALFPNGAFFVYLSYNLRLFSAVVLGYVVYTIVYFIRKGVKAGAKRYRIFERVVNDYAFRTGLFAVCSFCTTFLYASFHALIASLSFSIWYGALAAYYGVLAFLRGGVLLNQGYCRKFVKDREERYQRTVYVYKACGYMLLLLTLALAVAMGQMMLSDKLFAYAHLSIYVTTVYVTIRVALAIFNFFKAKKQENLSVYAIRQINLADAAVSVFALQAAMLSTFPAGRVDKYLLNSALGVIVCLLIIFIGISMIKKANRLQKREDL